MRSTRRTILAAGGAAAVMPTKIFAQAAVPELQTLRSTSKSWLWAAEDYANAGGFFERARVKVVSNASNRGTNIAALSGSGVDIVLGDPGEAMRAKSQGLPIKSLIGTVNKLASNVVLRTPVLARAGVTEASPVQAKYAALRGLRLGTTGPGGAPDQLLRWMALKAGMNPNSDIRLVPIQGGGPGMMAGLQQNVIDGFCLSSPTSDLAVQDRDCGYLFNMALNPPPEFEQYLYIIASASEATLASKREALVRYAHGIAAALKSIATEPDKLKAWADVWFEGLPPQIMQVSFDINSKIFFTDPVPKPDLFQKNVDFINTANRSMGAEPIPPLTFAQQYDPSIAQEGLSRL